MRNQDINQTGGLQFLAGFCLQLLQTIVCNRKQNVNILSNDAQQVLSKRPKHAARILTLTDNGEDNSISNVHV